MYFLLRGKVPVCICFFCAKTFFSTIEVVRIKKNDKVGPNTNRHLQTRTFPLQLAVMKSYPSAEDRVFLSVDVPSWGGTKSKMDTGNLLSVTDDSFWGDGIDAARALREGGLVGAHGGPIRRHWGSLALGFA